MSYLESTTPYLQILVSPNPKLIQTLFSYLLAGISAAFSSLCYAEFGSRVPKAGSAYSYTYVSTIPIPTTSLPPTPTLIPTTLVLVLNLC